MQLRRHTLLVVLAVLFCALPAAAQEPGQTITGEVVAVKDGDTIDVMYGGRAVTVRLHGIDAPETGGPLATTQSRRPVGTPSERSPACGLPTWTATADRWVLSQMPVGS
jgi:endonuclease YncB( thermonuclease family)